MVAESLEARRLLSAILPVTVNGFSIGSGRPVLADFTTDGKDDIAVSTGAAITIFPGMGDGTFGPEINLSGYSNPSTPCAADFNGDGRVDLAVSTFLDKRVSILLNTGGATFSVTPYSVSATGTLRAADIDGDGDTDLICGNNGLTLFRNLGDGAFAIAPLNLTDAVDAALADFNRDGFIDIAASSVAGGDARVFLNTGTGAFSSGMSFAGVSQSAKVDVGDFDGDNAPDLILRVIATRQIALLWNTGAGAFAPPQALPDSVPAMGLSIGDLNTDGRDDLVVGSSSTFALLLSQPGRSFSTNVDNYAGTNSWNFAIRDLDGDQFPDVVSSTNAYVAVHRGKGDGTLIGPRALLPVNADSTSVINLNDFNNDGVADLLAKMANDLIVYARNSSGEIINSIRSSLGVAVVWKSIADLNGDGFLDMAFADVTTTYATFNNGQGGFLTPIPLWSRGFGNATGSGDFDGDGDTDIAAGDVDGFRILRNNGSGVFTAESVGYVTPSPLRGMDAGDLNNDGLVDLVTASVSARTISTYISTPSGSFTANHYPLSGAFQDVLLVDLNHDAKLDIVYANNSAGRMLNLGGGLFSNAVPIGSGTPAVAADFDNDGNVDLAFGGSTISLYRGVGDGSFTSMGRYLSFPTSGGLVASDFTSDGNVDLVVGGKSLYVLANQRPAIAPVLTVVGYDVDSRQITYRSTLPISAQSVSSSDVTIETTNGLIIAHPDSAVVSPDLKTLVFALPVDLPDGSFVIRLHAGSVTGLSGVATTADVSSNTFILRGDINRDRSVNFDDLLTLAQNYGQTGRTFSQGNIDYSSDGLVGFDDLLILSQRFGTGLFTDVRSNGPSRQRQRRLEPDMIDPVHAG